MGKLVVSFGFPNEVVFHCKIVNCIFLVFFSAREISAITPAPPPLLLSLKEKMCTNMHLFQDIRYYCFIAFTQFLNSMESLESAMKQNRILSIALRNWIERAW